MGFFTLSTGKKANEEGNTTFENGGNYDPMPDNTTVVAAISKISWAAPSDYYLADSIKAEWDVLEPAAYAGRKFKQAIKIYDPKPDVADKAKTMLSVMDSITGGKIMAEISRTNMDPDDNILALALINRPMTLTLGLFTPKEADKSAMNWVKKVTPRVRGGVAQVAAPTNKDASPTPAETPAQRQARLRAERQPAAPVPQAQVEEEIDDGDIPF